MNINVFIFRIFLTFLNKNTFHSSEFLFLWSLTNGHVYMCLFIPCFMKSTESVTDGQSFVWSDVQLRYALWWQWKRRNTAPQQLTGTAPGAPHGRILPVRSGTLIELRDSYEWIIHIWNFMLHGGITTILSLLIKLRDTIIGSYT